MGPEGPKRVFGPPGGQKVVSPGVTGERVLLAPRFSVRSSTLAGLGFPIWRVQNAFLALETCFWPLQGSKQGQEGPKLVFGPPERKKWLRGVQNAFLALRQARDIGKHCFRSKFREFSTKNQ